MQFLFLFSRWRAQFLISLNSFSYGGSCTNRVQENSGLKTFAAMKGETCLSNLREEGKDNSEWGFQLIRLTRWYSSITLVFWFLFFLFLMRQFLEKNGDSLHFCLFFEWTVVSSLFSWTMGIKYYSLCFVKTIKVAHLSWRAHLFQGWLQTHTQALWAWTPKSHCNQDGLSTVSSVTTHSSFCQDSACVPMLPSDA